VKAATWFNRPMRTGCPRCGDATAVGVLCRGCADALPPCPALMREHVSSRHPADGAAGWMIDRFGAAHALRTGRSLVGRETRSDLLILHGSVSRDHAELTLGADGWELRDLGSRNRTQVDARRIDARVRLGGRAIVRFGDVAFYFFGEPVALPATPDGSVATAHARDAASSYVVRGATVELCLLASAGAGGSLLHRSAGAPTWQELDLPALEYHLLRVLCARAAEQSASPSRTHAAVTTRALVDLLPFHSASPSDENVRQVVRRLRATLEGIGAGGAVESVPGRGYYLAWPVDA
jgi:hypothetical protein